MSSLPSSPLGNQTSVASMSSSPSRIPMVPMSSPPSTVLPNHINHITVTSRSPPPSSPLRNQVPMAFSPSRMTSPVADMSSAAHQAQAPSITNMDCLSDPSSPVTPARRNLATEAPYATPASLVAVNIFPLILPTAFSTNFLAFTGAKALYNDNGRARSSPRPEQSITSPDEA